MKRTILVFTPIVLLAAAIGCAPSQLTAYTFPLHYSPIASMGEYSAARDCAGYGDLVVADARADKSKVGVRYLEQGSSRYDVMADGDVEAWLRQAAERALSAAGIENDASSGKTVTVKLASIVTDEAVYRRAEYDGRVVVDAAVSGGGASWSAKKDGFSENYGYAGSAENYQETLNHALDRAMAAMVNDSGFVDALCK